MGDVANVCDLLRPVWEQTDGHDGYVSIEVDAHLAHDTQATIDEATLLHDTVAKPNLLVKIPASHAGVSAIEEMTARGHSISVTLVFSLPGDGGLSRRPGEIGRSGRRPQKRALRRQRCLWASTSTKDASLRDTLYVEEQIGPETISTMPEATIRAFQSHGRVDLTLESQLEESQHLFRRLYAAGVDYEDVVAMLAHEGIRLAASRTRNEVEGNLQCKSNGTKPTGASNRVQGDKEDQCAGL